MHSPTALEPDPSSPPLPAPVPGRLLAVAAVDSPGGAETTLLRLLRRLQSRGWEVTLTTPGDGPLREAARQAGHSWLPLAVGGLEAGSGARAVAAWPRLRWVARGAGVVYLNGAVCGRMLPALIGGSARRVLHVHDIVTRAPGFWRLADVVLAASGAVADRMGGLRSHVVYGPVDPDPPLVEAPWEAGAASVHRPPVIGFVGRIEPRKGPLDLVRAAPLIRAVLPGVRIVMVGDDPYQTDPAYTAAVRASSEVEHYGWVENAPGLMRHLDVLVLPSYQEPFGTVLAEAMAVGTPVVATLVGGLAEVVQDGVTGRLINPGDPEALAGAIVDVLRDRARMGAAARDAARRFDGDRYAERVERLIAG